MKAKQVYHDLDVKYKSNGQIDLDYYRMNAMELRTKYHAEMIKNTIASIKRFFASMCDNSICAYLKPSH